MTVEIKQNKTFEPSILLLALWLCLFLLVNPVVARDDDEREKSREKPEVEALKVETPKIEEPKKEESRDEKKEEIKVEIPKVEVPKVETPKIEEPKKEEVKVEAPKVETPKVEELKKEEVKVEAPKPKVERPKKDDLPEFIPQLELPPPPKNGVGQVITPQTTTVIQGNIDESKIEKPKDEGNEGKENKEIKEEKGEKEGIKEDVEDLPESIIENPIIPIIPSNTEPEEILPTSSTPTPVTTGANSNENLQSCKEGCDEQSIENYDLSNFLIEVPKGSTFATKVPFLNQRNRTTNINKELLDKVTSVVLTDSSGKSHDAGFAFFENSSFTEEYKYQVLGNYLVGLTTIIKIPDNASTGNAVVLVLSSNKLLLSIPLKIIDSKEVKVKARNKVKKIGLPQIRNPIVAYLIKSEEGKIQLKLTIKGRNFIGKIAIIDGKLQKLVDQTGFYTNVTFVPNSGIEIKEFTVSSGNEISLIAEIKDDITGGIKFFNVITPKGIDVGAIIFPEQLSEGKLEATDDLGELLLEGRETIEATIQGDTDILDE